MVMNYGFYVDKLHEVSALTSGRPSCSEPPNGLLLGGQSFSTSSITAEMFDSPTDPLSPHVEFDKDTWPCVLMAMLGLFLSLGNVSIQYAWAFVGLPVAQVITSSIAVVIGTSLNYFLDNKINKASILFPGVACFLTAVLLGSTVHSSNTAANVAKLRSFHENMKDTPDVPEDSNLKGGKSEKDIVEDIEVGNLNAEETKKAGTAESIIGVENQRAIKVYTNLEGTSWAILSLIKAGQGTVDPIPIERGRDY